MKEHAKRLARVLLGDYAAFYVYSRSLEKGSQAGLRSPTAFKVVTIDESAIKSSTESLIRDQAGYGGPGSHAYACYEGDRIVGVCFYWFGDRYRKRNFWPLVSGEAKLVQIISLPDERGRGVATMLIGWSSRNMAQKGFYRVYARVWHSNTSSLRAFERAGWARIALVIEINPLRRSRPVRIRMGCRPSGQNM